MSDTFALARLCCQRSKRLLLATVVAFCSLQIMLLSGGYANNSNEAFISIYVMGMVPIAFLSIVLFDSGSAANLTVGSSGYDPWLIRSPIASWKLAVVPIVLKTAWLFVMWVVSVVVLCHVMQRPLVSMLPAFSFAAATTWLCYIAWRPFTGIWTRLFLGAAIMLFSYVVMIWAVAVTFEMDELQYDRRLLTYGGLLVSIISMIAGVWFSIRAVKLARQSHGGIISESSRRGVFDFVPALGRASSIELNSLPAVTRGESQTSRTLVAAEFWKTSGQFSKVLLLGWVPIILVCVFAVPFHPVTAIFVVIFAACTAALGNPHRAYCDNHESRQLATWMVSAPISTVNMAWSRLWGVALNWGVMILPLLLIYALWMLWPSNREVWSRYVNWAIERYGSEASAYGLAGAVALTSTVAFLSFPIRGSWVDMSGKSWLVVLFAVGAGLVPIVLIGFLSRFMWRQKNWESARAEAIELLEYLPIVVVILLVAKCLAVTIAIIKLRQQRLVSASAICKLIFGWGVIVTACAAITTVGIKEEFATPLFCFIAFMMIIPLASVLAAPLSLASNRHR